MVCRVARDLRRAERGTWRFWGLIRNKGKIKDSSLGGSGFGFGLGTTYTDLQYVS